MSGLREKTGCALLVLALLLLASPGALRAEDPMFLLGDACVSCHLTCERCTPEISVVAWKKSVHFRPDVTCAACHGGDRYLALPFKKNHMGLPGPAEAEASCGACHERELADFLYLRPQSGKKGCKAGCIACHSHHEVAKAGPELVNDDACGACHKPDKAAKAVAASRELIAQRAALVALLETRRQAGLPVSTFEDALAAIDKKSARAFHSAGMGNLPGALADGPARDMAELLLKLSQDSPAGFKAQGIFVTLLIALAFCVLFAIFRSLPKQGDKK